MAYQHHPKESFDVLESMKRRGFIPVGWDDYTINIFLEACQIFIDDLRNHPKDFTRIKNYVFSATGKTCFSLEMILEFAKLFKAYFLMNSKAQYYFNDQSFSDLYDNYKELITYFPDSNIADSLQAHDINIPISVYQNSSEEHEPESNVPSQSSLGRSSCSLASENLYNKFFGSPSSDRSPVVVERLPEASWYNYKEATERQFLTSGGTYPNKVSTGVEQWEQEAMTDSLESLSDYIDAPPEDVNISIGSDLGRRPIWLNDELSTNKDASIENKVAEKMNAEESFRSRATMSPELISSGSSEDEPLNEILRTLEPSPADFSTTVSAMPNLFGYRDMLLENRAKPTTSTANQLQSLQTIAIENSEFPDTSIEPSHNSNNSEKKMKLESGDLKVSAMSNETTHHVTDSNEKLKNDSGTTGFSVLQEQLENIADVVQESSASNQNVMAIKKAVKKKVNVGYNKPYNKLTRHKVDTRKKFQIRPMAFKVWAKYFKTPHKLTNKSRKIRNKSGAKGSKLFRKTLKKSRNVIKKSTALTQKASAIENSVTSADAIKTAHQITNSNNKLTNESGSKNLNSSLELFENTRDVIEECTASNLKAIENPENLANAIEETTHVTDPNAKLGDEASLMNLSMSPKSLGIFGDVVKESATSSQKVSAIENSQVSSNFNKALYYLNNRSEKLKLIPKRCAKYIKINHHITNMNTKLTKTSGHIDLKLSSEPPENTEIVIDEGTASHKQFIAIHKSVRFSNSIRTNWNRNLNDESGVENLPENIGNSTEQSTPSNKQVISIKKSEVPCRSTRTNRNEEINNDSGTENFKSFPKPLEDGYSLESVASNKNTGGVIKESTTSSQQIMGIKKSEVPFNSTKRNDEDDLTDLSEKSTNESDIIDLTIPSPEPLEDTEDMIEEITASSQQVLAIENSDYSPKSTRTNWNMNLDNEFCIKNIESFPIPLEDIGSLLIDEGIASNQNTGDVIIESTSNQQVIVTKKSGVPLNSTKTNRYLTNQNRKLNHHSGPKNFESFPKQLEDTGNLFEERVASIKNAGDVIEVSTASSQQVVAIKKTSNHIRTTRHVTDPDKKITLIDLTLPEPLESTGDNSEESVAASQVIALEKSEVSFNLTKTNHPNPSRKSKLFRENFKVSANRTKSSRHLSCTKKKSIGILKNPKTSANSCQTSHHLTQSRKISEAFANSCKITQHRTNDPRVNSKVILENSKSSVNSFKITCRTNPSKQSKVMPNEFDMAPALSSSRSIHEEIEKEDPFDLIIDDSDDEDQDSYSNDIKSNTALENEGCYATSVEQIKNKLPDGGNVLQKLINCGEISLSVVKKSTDDESSLQNDVTNIAKSTFERLEKRPNTTNSLLRVNVELDSVDSNQQIFNIEPNSVDSYQLFASSELHANSQLSPNSPQKEDLTVTHNYDIETTSEEVCLEIFPVGKSELTHGANIAARGSPNTSSPMQTVADEESVHKSSPISNIEMVDLTTKANDEVANTSSPMQTVADEESAQKSSPISNIKMVDLINEANDEVAITSSPMQTVADEESILKSSPISNIKMVDLINKANDEVANTSSPMQTVADEESVQKSSPISNIKMVDLINKANDEVANTSSSIQTADNEESVLKSSPISNINIKIIDPINKANDEVANTSSSILTTADKESVQESSPIANVKIVDLIKKKIRQMFNLPTETTSCNDSNGDHSKDTTPQSERTYYSLEDVLKALEEVESFYEIALPFQSSRIQNNLSSNIGISRFMLEFEIQSLFNFINGNILSDSCSVTDRQIIKKRLQTLVNNLANNLGLVNESAENSKLMRDSRDITSTSTQQFLAEKSAEVSQLEIFQSLQSMTSAYTQLIPPHEFNESNEDINSLQTCDFASTSSSINNQKSEDQESRSILLSSLECKCKYNMTDDGFIGFCDYCANQSSSPFSRISQWLTRVKPLDFNSSDNYGYIQHNEEVYFLKRPVIKVEDFVKSASKKLCRDDARSSNARMLTENKSPPSNSNKTLKDDHQGAVSLNASPGIDAPSTSHTDSAEKGKTDKDNVHKKGNSSGRPAVNRNLHQSLLDYHLNDVIANSAIMGIIERHKNFDYGLNEEIAAISPQLLEESNYRDWYQKFWLEYQNHLNWTRTLTNKMSTDVSIADGKVGKVRGKLFNVPDRRRRRRRR